MENSEHIGEKLKRMAKDKGMKHPDIARVFGIEPPSVYEWYSTGRIAKRHYAKLVEWSGKSLNWWFDVPELQHPQEPYKISEAVRPYLVSAVVEWPFKLFSITDWLALPQDKQLHLEEQVEDAVKRARESANSSAGAAHSTS